MLILRVAGLVLGSVLTFGTLWSVVRTVIVPRASASRLSALLAAAVQGGISKVARTVSDYRRRDEILAQGTPLFLVLRLVAWIGLLVLGYGLIFWGTSSGNLAQSFRLSASSILPLGLTHAGSGLATAIAFLEVASGVIVVALQIAYLPTLYGTFNRRETLVTMLASSSGSPPWGPEILARHALIDNQEHLADLYHDWEQWAADIAESHTSYASLLYFRSPDPRTSWILALVACMDAAAMQLALNPLTGPSSARPFLRMGIDCLRSLARVTSIPYLSDPLPDDAIELPEEAFQDAVQRLLAVGWQPERTVEDAWRHFRGWRVNYEAVAYRLASLIDAPPGPWAGTRFGNVESSIIPVRPPHREPSPERAQLLKVTRKRQALRAVGDRGARMSVRPAPGPPPEPESHSASGP